MTEPDVTKRRHRLTNMVYDEVSFVDAGANQHADVVLVKRAGVEKLMHDPSPKTKSSAPKQTADWYHENKAPTDASGTKTDLRAQHWEESRHPRIVNGTWAETSGASKKKYGKGGTTKAKLTAAQRAAKKALAAKKKKLAAEKRALALKNKKVGYRLVMGPNGTKTWQHVKASLETTKKPKPDMSGTVSVKKYLNPENAALSYLERTS